jgi:hypothetical protein
LFTPKSSRKPFRQSNLRKTFNTDDDDESAGTSGDGAARKDEDEEDNGPAVIRPVNSRSTSARQKSRPKPSSKLSFGGEAADATADEDVPKKSSLGQRTLENSAFKKSLGTRGLPLRSMQEDDDDRPRYSKEYLAELQSTTPNTPKDVSALAISDPDEMELDASELEGAMIVDSPAATPSKPETTILTDAEIREKKERRARLAQESGFLSMEDDSDDIRLRPKKEETRLKAEDEELGEGFDDYVEDGGLSLGKRAERERKKQERAKMAELIHNAEGNDTDSSADSDAERRIAYESAQTRAGMDGLKKPRKDPNSALLQVPPKITPLPVLSECIARLQASLKAMEAEVSSKARRVQQLQSEKQEIIQREGEVQALLDETGKKYQEAMGKGGIENGATDGAPVVAKPELAGERGLESLGATPRRNGEVDEEPE